MRWLNRSCISDHAIYLCSYGLVVLVVNTLVLYLLGYYFLKVSRSEVCSGAARGPVDRRIEQLPGKPVRPGPADLPDEQAELRRRVIAEDRGLMQSLMARSRIEKINRLAAIKAASTELPLPASDEPAGEIDEADIVTALPDQSDSAAQAKVSRREVSSETQHSGQDSREFTFTAGLQTPCCATVGRC